MRNLIFHGVVWRYCLIGLVWVGCDDSPTEPTRRLALFTYVSPAATSEPGLSDPDFTGCAHHYGPLHLSLATSWTGFETTRMTETGVGTAQAFVADVPTGTELGIYVYDVALCKTDPSVEPATPLGLSVDGQPIERIGSIDGHAVALFMLATR